MSVPALSELNKQIREMLGLLSEVDQLVSGGAGGGGSMMSGALASFTPSSKGVLGMNVAGAAITAVGGVAAAGSSMMPNTLAVIGREETVYRAGVSMGGMVSRGRALGQITAALGGRQIMDNASAEVLNVLAQTGVAPTSAKFMEVARGAGGAARLLNMPENRSAMAMQALSAGPMAANFLQNYGMFTANPVTGQEYSQTQIFGQLANRLTQGNIGNMSTEELLTDIRRGALGFNIANSGMSADQQELFKTYLIAQTQGVNLDLSDSKSVEEYGRKLEAQGYENPLKAFQELTSKEEELREAATEPYIAGIKDATGALMELKNFTRDELIPAFGQLKASIDTFTGDTAGAGVLGAGASILGGAAQIGGAVASYNMLSKAAGGKAIGQSMGALATKMGPALATAGKTVGKAAPGLGAAFTGIQAFQDAQSGKGFDLGGALLNTAVAAGFGFLAGGPAGAAIAGAATMAGALGGNMLGSMSGEGGNSDSSGAGTMGPTGQQNEAFYLQHPTKSARMGARYGAKYSIYSGQLVWPDGHKGIDYEGTKGDLIHASAPGTAYIESGGELGLRVKIQHTNGMYTFYCHLNGTDVKNGQKVERGTVVGRMGNTGGKSTGVHLHFALSKTSTTAGHVDPEPYLRGGANYLEAATADQSQSASGNNPAPSGNSVSEAASGGTDTSSVSSTSNASNLSGSASAVDVVAPGAAGSSSGQDVESWSSSDWALSGSGAAGAAPEGGENTTDAPGYLPVTPLGKGRQAAAAGGKNVTNNVTINLSIAQASEEEAKRFALMVKEQLDDENILMQMGRK